MQFRRAVGFGERISLGERVDEDGDHELSAGESMRMETTLKVTPKVVDAVEMPSADGDSKQAKPETVDSLKKPVRTDQKDRRMKTKNGEDTADLGIPEKEGGPIDWNGPPNVSKIDNAREKQKNDLIHSHQNNRTGKNHLDPERQVCTRDQRKEQERADKDDDPQGDRVSNDSRKEEDDLRPAQHNNQAGKDYRNSDWQKYISDPQGTDMSNVGSCGEL
jgi:hypothetical protein